MPAIRIFRAPSSLLAEPRALEWTLVGCGCKRWHSSGITTTVIGALTRGSKPLQDELGIHVCGGRGKHSRRTPDELARLGERTGFDAARLTRASRLVAKVDSAPCRK